MKREMFDQATRAGSQVRAAVRWTNKQTGVRVFECQPEGKENTRGRKVLRPRN